MPEKPVEFTLRQMLCGYWISQAIYVAARLEIADLVKDGPRTTAELASASGAHEPSLYRLLRALASQGIFAETAPRTFTLTPLGECLRGDAPHTMRPVALMMGEEHFAAWGQLLHSVRTGECAFEHAFGENIFTYLARHPEAARTFDAAMTGIHGRESAAMLEACDFAGINTLLDVGGGNGTLLAAVLRKYPALRGILFDLPHVIERSQQNLEAWGLAGRCRAVAGDFFQAVPSGADAILLRHIIHDWDEPRAGQILANCRQALRVGGRLLVVETVIQPGNEPDWGKLLDLNMLVMPGGQERTEAEYRKLLAAAGFTLQSVVPTRADVCILAAEAA